MPRIETFDAGNLALHPTETGVEAQAGAARRLVVFYNQQAGAAEMLARETERLGGETQQLGRETEQLGSEKGTALRQAGQAIGSGIAAAGDAAVSYLDHQQISHGSASYAKLLQQATTDWNTTLANADPNDPHVAQRFLENLEGQLQNFQNNGFYTERAQQWAEGHVEALRQHFADKTLDGMSELAGTAVKVNSQQTLNSLSNTAHDDPSSVDIALASWKSTLEGQIATSPNLGGKAGAVRLELQQKGAEAIVKSAAIGQIEKTGKLPSWVSDPKYSPYINGAQLAQFEKAAKAQAKSDLLTEKQLQLYGRQIADQRAHADANKAFTDNVSIDPTSGRPVINPNLYKDALAVAKNNPGAPNAAAAARTLFDWGEHQQNQKAQPTADDPATKQQLTDRLFDPSNPTTRVDLMRAQVEGKLSDHSFQAMERLVTELEQSPLKGPVWQSVTSAVKDQLIRTDIKSGDKVGADNYAAFMQDFLPQYLAKSRAGTLPPNALNMNDPNSMISQYLAPYRPSMQDRLKAAAPTAEKAAEPPEALRGIASLSYSKSRNLYRDDATGKVYRPDGTEVK